MTKWAPFNSVTDTGSMADDVNYHKNIISKPTLSEDQLYNIGLRLTESYHDQTVINIKLYRNGKLYLKKGLIKNIDPLKQEILLNDNYKLYFSQIIEIL